jgi:hypothetical protein
MYIQVDQPDVRFETDAGERLLKNTNSANQAKVSAVRTGLYSVHNTHPFIYLCSIYSVLVILRRLNGYPATEQKLTSQSLTGGQSRLWFRVVLPACQATYYSCRAGTTTL